MADLVLLDADGNEVRLTPRGIPGAESQPCDVDGAPDLIGLIPGGGGPYPAPLADKLSALVAGKYTHPLFAFPKARLGEPHSPKGEVWGFLADRFPGVSLAEALLTLTDGERVPTALALIEVFFQAERLRIVMGDNHPGNFWRDPADGTIRGIDPIRFFFSTKFVTHYCPLALKEYLAWELHGKDISKEVLDRYTDRFALGLLIFEVLTGGHPCHFAWGGVVPDIPRRVKEKVFIGTKNMPSGAKVPDEVERRLKALPDEVKVLFEKALIGDRLKRPSPKEWAEALKKLTPTVPQSPEVDHLALLMDEGRKAVLWTKENWNKVAALVIVGLALHGWTSKPLSAPPQQPRASQGLIGGEHPQGGGGAGVVVGDGGDGDKPAHAEPDQQLYKILFAPAKKGGGK